jgi:hypothetical protein
VTSANLSAHLQVTQYGGFRLTEAIRPSPKLPVVPRQGYRIDTYRDAKAGLRVPVLAAAVSAERLFDTFLSLLQPLSPVVDVILETSHDDAAGHKDLRREGIDRPVLESHFCEFEELLLNDGCTGVAVVGTDAPIEVQFDEHKLLIVYARALAPFERVLRDARIPRDDHLPLITEGEHVHTTESRYSDLFEQLRNRLGAGHAAEHVNW